MSELPAKSRLLALHEAVCSIKKAMVNLKYPKSLSNVVEMLRTSLLVLEGREDLNHEDPSVRELKSSMLSKIDEFERADQEARKSESRSLIRRMFPRREAAI